MIKINLATRKSSTLTNASGGGAGASFGLGGGKLDFSKVKDLPIRKLLVPALVCYGAEYILDTYKTDELAKVDAVISKLGAEKVQLEAEAEKIKGYEELKKSLDADEFTMRTKIETIQKLVDERTTPPKVMIELSKAVPKEVWLTEFKIDKSEVLIKGASTSFQPISDFMKSLSENALFTDVRTRGTQEGKDERGVDIKLFELSAQRRGTL